MTRTEAVAKVQRLLAFRTDRASEIIAEINDSLTRLDMAATRPWFLTVVGTSLVTVEDSPYVDVPENFLDEYEEGSFQVYDPEEGFWHDLEKNDLDQLREIYKSTTGCPEGYALVNDKFVLFPTPDAAYTLSLDYNKKDSALAEGESTNGYLTYVPELIVGMAGLRIAEAIRDTAAMKVFGQMEATARVELYRQNEAKRSANAPAQMGGPC